MEAAKRVDYDYECLLKESINRLLQEYGNESCSCDFSGFRSIFFRLIQASSDPPLEIIWFYSAVSSFHFHETTTNNLDDDLLNRVLTAKTLFQLIASCSSSSHDAIKCIALLAPLLFKLHRFVIETRSGKKLSTKTDKKLIREIECLIEGIVSYISICMSNKFCVRDGIGLPPCFVDLISVWTVDRSEGDPQVGGGLRMFFPLVSDDICNAFSREGCGIDYLAGVVIAEAFLMRLCLKMSRGGLKSDLKKELRILAVGSITSFRSCEFFEVLLRLLLEPTLPVISLLNSEDEAILREVLYDVVILVDYSFLNSEPEVEQFDDHRKDLFMIRLLVVHEAIRAARANGGQTKAISYINAFSRSRLPSELIVWAAGQIGIEIPNRFNVTTPHALLKWLLNLEDRGLRLKLPNSSRTKLVVDELMLDNEYPIFKTNSKKMEGDIFYMDKKVEEAETNGGEDQEMQSENTLFFAAAQTMKFTSNGGGRKRRGGRGGETQVKFLKYRLDDSPVKENISSFRVDSGMSSESEVENLLSDEDTEEMEQ